MVPRLESRRFAMPVTDWLLRRPVEVGWAIFALANLAAKLGLNR